MDSVTRVEPLAPRVLLAVALGPAFAFPRPIASATGAFAFVVCSARVTRRWTYVRVKVKVRVRVTVRVTVRIRVTVRVR